MRWRGGGASIGIVIVILLSVSFSISNELSMIGFWGDERGGFAAKYDTPRHSSARMVRNVKDAEKAWTINAKLVKNGCAGINIVVAILG